MRVLLISMHLHIYIYIYIDIDIHHIHLSIYLYISISIYPYAGVYIYRDMYDTGLHIIVPTGSGYDPGAHVSFPQFGNRSLANFHEAPRTEI